MTDRVLQPCSLDVAAQRRRELLQLFPDVRTEGEGIDLERLRMALGEGTDIAKERYGLTWAGKANCYATIHARSIGTLLPAPAKSVNFDSTNNVIIEGDNLEVLKLLQRSYLGKVGMIYIDPPYNTGNDFIYPDDFSESLTTYLQYTGQADAEGRRFGTNSDRDGRFHSKWLSMMFPRLYLARNLLVDHGVLMVSIDDGEDSNLRAILNEIFGEENFCGAFIWEKKRKPSFLDAMMGSKTEYVLAYAKNKALTAPFTNGTVEQGKMYPFNNAGNPLAVLTFPAGAVDFAIADCVVEPQDMSEGNIKAVLLDQLKIRGGKNVESFRLEGEWRYSQKKVDEFVAAGEQIIIRRIPFRPNYVNQSERDKKTANLLTAKGTGTPTYEDATEEVRNLFGADVLEYPKPVGLIRYLIAAATRGGDLVLDFFAGSGTTAHAVLDLNERGGIPRKFILVQLPENTGLPDYPTICDLTEERVRRVIERQIKDKAERLDGTTAHGATTGFRVFTLAESNIKGWDMAPGDAAELGEQLALNVDHIRHDRNDLDLLYEILLRSGFQLAEKVRSELIEERRVYSILDGALLVCLERPLTLALLRAIALRNPQRVTVLDEAFEGNDQLKTNAVKFFEARDIVFQTL